MLAELRGYDPKPGLRFGGGGGAPVVPDILLRRRGQRRLGHRAQPGDAAAADRQPQLLRRAAAAAPTRRAQSWLEREAGRRQLADQGARPAGQDHPQGRGRDRQAAGRFFRRGVSELRPLTLRAVAEAIEMHESTVSRVTSNKYLPAPRGTFELKYFFTSGVGVGRRRGRGPRRGGQGAIRALIDAEDAERHPVRRHAGRPAQGKGFDLARRTVAKYREAIGHRQFGPAAAAEEARGRGLGWA